MNQAIQDFIQSKRIAVVGVSRTGKQNKFGNIAYAELKQRGWSLGRSLRRWFGHS